MRRFDLRRNARRSAISWLLLAVAAAAPLRACWFPERQSVHFNSFRPDFFRMPRPWPGTPPDSRAQPPTESAWLHNDDPGPDSPPADELPPAVSAALRSEASGHFRAAAANWEQVSDLVKADPDRDKFGPKPPPQLSGLRERILALRAWRGVADTAALRTILRARDLLNVNRYRECEAALAGIHTEPYLRHADYLRACVTFYTRGAAESAPAFQSLARRRPGDPLPLYMVGRSYFRRVSRDELRDESQPDTALNLSEAKYPPLTREARAETLKKALRAYQACASADPSGDLGGDAEEMAAACRFRLGEHAWPLLIYCRRLGELPAGAEDWRMWDSARSCLQEMSREEHRAFQKLAVTDAAAAGAYLDLLVHYGRPTADSLAQLGLFALQVLQRCPSARVSGRVSAALLARLAAIENRLRHPDHAERLARSALQRGAAGMDREEARWQLAQALHGTGKDVAALAEYEELAARSPVGRFQRGAHEAAAMLEEERGDLVESLRHYFALEYHLDCAYLLDCLAAPVDLEQFLRRYPHHPQARLVRYSLGFRQLRRGEYRAAERTFSGLGSWLPIAEKLEPCKNAGGEPRTPPLQAARILNHADLAERRGRSPREKARAAYEAAAFLYRQRFLLFYNGALWRGMRIQTFDLYPLSDLRTRRAKVSPPEQAARDRYEEEHAVVFQALRRFERIARQYPHTPEAPKALASAALCYLALPNMGHYWYKRTGNTFIARATECYRRILKDYPHDPLAKTANAFAGLRGSL